MASHEFQSVFWDDLAADLEDPTFRETHIETSAAISAIDRAVGMTDIMGPDDGKRSR